MGYRELTRQEKTAIRKLVVQWCANYDRDYGCLLGLGPPRKLYLRGERRSNEMSELSPRAEANDMEFVTTCGCYMLGKTWTGPMCRYFRQAVLPLDPALEQALAQEEVVLERRVCPLCGRSFVPKRRQLYCSPVCQAEANRRKSRARMRNKRAKDGFRCYDLSPQKPCK